MSIYRQIHEAIADGRGNIMDTAGRVASEQGYSEIGAWTRYLETEYGLSFNFVAKAMVIKINTSGGEPVLSNSTPQNGEQQKNREALLAELGRAENFRLGI